MKRLLVLSAVLFVFSVSLPSEMQGMMAGKEEQGMMSMQMCQQKIKRQGMMMKDMVQMMKEMMEMQEELIKDMKPPMKEKMMKQMSIMKERMDKMMEGMRGQALPQRLRCAEEWLKKAIELHELHINDPKTATKSSQMEMMEQMKKAYECVRGSGKSSEEIEGNETEGEEPKADPHSH